MDSYQKEKRNPCSPPPVPCLPPALPAAREEAITVTQEERTLAMLCHLLAIFTGFLGPLVLWLVKKEESAFVDHHGRESLNFQLTVFIAMMALMGATFVLMFVFIGILLVPFLFVIPLLCLIAEIAACASASGGNWFRYPCCIRFL